ncbi:MAG: oxidoreductase [Brevundimonas sp.]|nr:oxidoreductase [Brevundimonas sp.]
MAAAARVADEMPAHLVSADPVGDAFRHGMRRLAGACSIITSCNGTDDRSAWVGLTATAVSSLTAEPPQLLVCVNRSVWAHGIITRSGVIGVNVLDGDQEALALRFAGRGACAPHEKFAVGDWSVERDGAPLLADALVGFDCRVAETIIASTHDVFICDVVGVRLRDQTTNPLIYFNGAFMAGSPADGRNMEGPGR